MDNVNQNPMSQGNMPPMPGMPMEKKKSNSTIIITIVVLILIVIGLLYFLGNKIGSNVPATTGDAVTDSLKAQGSGDDLNSIENDLNSTNLNNLDQGAAAVESELNGQGQ